MGQSFTSSLSLSSHDNSKADSGSPTFQIKKPEIQDSSVTKGWWFTRGGAGFEARMYLVNMV